MNPFRDHEPKAKVESRTTTASVELVLIVGLVVLLIVAMSG
ncbi:hypothetical protein [Algimonas porphyrae]